MKVKLRIIGITLLLLMVTFETTAQSRLGANEASFYTNRIGPQRKMLRLTGANNGNDSRTLNNEITRMSNQGGGIIRLLKPNNRPYIYTLRLDPGLEVVDLKMFLYLILD